MSLATLGDVLTIIYPSRQEILTCAIRVNVGYRSRRRRPNPGGATEEEFNWHAPLSCNHTTDNQSLQFFRRFRGTAYARNHLN